MTKTKTLTVAAVAVAALLGTNVAAFAQAASTDGGNGVVDPSAPNYKRQGSYKRPLTVRATPAAAPVVAPAPAPVVNPIYGLGTVVSTPFTVLGGAFGGKAGPRKGGVTEVRYANAGAETDKIDEGFGAPVPVDKSGPIYVVENGDPTISPLTFIGGPISAAGSIVQLPFKIIGAPFGGAAGY